jgi:hypothetical protein
MPRLLGMGMVPGTDADTSTGYDIVLKYKVQVR